MSSFKSSKPSTRPPKHKSARKSAKSAESKPPPTDERSSRTATLRSGVPALPIVDDLDDFSAPPIAGKAHPRHAMDEVVPTLDDSDRYFRHHPNEPGSESFSFDPDSADAAADLAADLGTEFLEGATRGQDMSDVIADESDREQDVGYLLEELGEEGESEEELEEDLSTTRK